MSIRLVRDSIARDALVELGKEYYEEMVKGVVDIGRRIIAVGGEMHADAEAILLEDGSRQSELWGFNILPGKPKEECLIYESFINIRPRDGNRTVEVESPGIREVMRGIILERLLL